MKNHLKKRSRYPNLLTIIISGQVQWLMPITPTFGEAEVAGSLEPRVSDQSRKHSETPYLH